VLRVGEPQDSAMVGRRIALLEEAVCASPAYLARHGTPRTPDELDGHRMIGFVSSVTGGHFPLEFLSGGTIRRITLPATVSVTGADMNVAAARLGFGLIQVPRYRLEEDFAAGTLVELLKDFPGPARPVSLLYLRDRQLSPRIRVFIDWLSREFAVRLAKP
jgi:DNA-binding transcriptional LysR family regulator